VARNADRRQVHVRKQTSIDQIHLGWPIEEVRYEGDGAERRGATDFPASILGPFLTMKCQWLSKENMQSLLTYCLCSAVFGLQTLCVSFHGTHEAPRNPRHAVLVHERLILGVLGPVHRIAMINLMSRLALDRAYLSKKLFSCDL